MKCLAVLLLWQSLAAHAKDQIVVGSKIFTESYILGEIAAEVLDGQSEVPVVRKLGMGSTGVVFEALKSGSIDVYPDYTGTIAETFLKRPELNSREQIRQALAPLGLTVSDSLGFNNTYALAVSEGFAVKHNLRSVSDLARIAPSLRAAFSYEFMDRQDGFNGMVKRYGLAFAPGNVSRMEHSLVYQAMQERAVDLIEVYSTDANIKRYALHVLEDDRHYFPNYQAVWVARAEFVARHPSAWRRLRDIEGSISEERMRSLNAEADINKTSFPRIASRFLGAGEASSRDETRFEQIAARTQEHLWLVGLALLFSVAVGVPLGVVSARSKISGQLILIFSAIVQTIPALAMLCFLIPLFGIGTRPALVALCLYSLLPVVLNTFTGIRGIDPRHLENAKAFGLGRLQILRFVVLPIASPTILAGIKTAAVVSVGTATLAALVGAGGYGALIVTGLSLNDIPLILTGAVPAAIMALAVHVIFALAEGYLVSRGLQRRA